MQNLIWDWLVRWLLALIGAGILAAVKILWNRQKAIELGVQALLRDRIITAYYKYAERGSISLHGLEAVEAMYKEYHALGGNGTVTKLMEDLRKMRVEDT